MAARKKEKEVNLLPQEEFEASSLGRILKWALSTFRIIVIVTEMVVMLAFLSRFWLDARSSDLNELITQRQVAIAAEKDFESEFRDTQKRLKVFTAMTEEPSSFSDILKLITSYLPPDVLLSSFASTSDSFQLKGISQSERGVAQFIANLESTNKFKSVSLVNVTTSESTGSTLIFTLEITRMKGS